MKILALLFVLAVFNFGCTKKVSTKDRVVLAWENAPKSVDPRYGLDANSQYLANLLHCALITFDATGGTVGQLAESWKWLSPTKLSVELKKGIQFSDGSPVKAADVEATYQFFKDESVSDPSPRKGAFKTVKSVKAVEDHNIHFELESPNAPFLTDLVIGILPVKWAKGPRVKETDAVPSCGPYTLKSLNASAARLVKNPKYNLGKVPPLDIEIKFVQDESTRYAKLLKGELDIVQNILSRDKLKSLESDSKKLKVLRRPGLNTSYVAFNMRDPLVKKAKVRRAVALAIDRKAIIDHVLQGYAVPANTLLTPTDKFYSTKLNPIPLDLEKAKKLLDEAGYKDPDGEGPKPRFTLRYLTTNNVTRVTIANAISSQLSKIGIQVEVQSLEWGKFKADVDKGRAQMWGLTWIGFKDPDIYRYSFAKESFPPDGGNRGWYHNGKLDTLLKSARESTDLTTRKSLYEKAQLIVAEDLPYVFLWHSEQFAVVNPAVQGFELYADGRLESLSKVYKN